MSSLMIVKMRMMFGTNPDGAENEKENAETATLKVY